jgi:protein-tyrosine phosphatase
LLAHLPRIVDAIVAGDVPMMIHCTAGKDRTGVAVALLLLALGVPRDAILADYARSDVSGENMRIAGSIEHGFREAFGFVPDAAVVRTLIGTEQAFLLAALDEVERGWGSVAGYLDAAGMSEARRAALRAALVETEDCHAEA